MSKQVNVTVTDSVKDFNSLVPSVQELIRAAVQVRDKAYCPYSDFQVGSAIRAANGQIYTGCNVENGAYGPTICAERTAIVKAVSEGHQTFTELAVAAYQEHDFTSPCGLCRQFISEFVSTDIPVYLAKPELGEVLCTSVCNLLPHRYISTCQKKLQREPTQQLIDAAIQVRKRAYCPYSNFAVGAAIRTISGEIFTGCNIENGSIGLSLCAERAAIANAISEGHRSFSEIAVVAYQENTFTSPCGMCRQVLSEFTPTDMPVYLAKPAPARVLCTSVCQLLPNRFIPTFQVPDNLNFTNLN